jgi:hypothetical protein
MLTLVPVSCPYRDYPQLSHTVAAASTANSDSLIVAAVLSCLISPIWLATRSNKSPFLLRSLESARGEWSMATMAWNLKRMFALSLA